MPSPGNKPFPWSALLWPFLWVYGKLAERREPKPTGPVFRLWDKDFNLLATFEGDTPWHCTIDHEGERFLYKMEFHHVPR